MEGPLFCKLCQLYCSGPENWKQHIDGSKHLKMFKRQKTLGGEQSLDMVNIPDQSSCNRNYQAKPNKKRPLADIPDEISLNKRPAMGVFKENGRGEYFCKACKVLVLGEQNVITHSRGKKHLKKVGEMKDLVCTEIFDNPNDPSFICEISANEDVTKKLREIYEERQREIHEERQREIHEERQREIHEKRQREICEERQREIKMLEHQEVEAGRITETQIENNESHSFKDGSANELKEVYEENPRKTNTLELQIDCKVMRVAALEVFHEEKQKEHQTDYKAGAVSLVDGGEKESIENESTVKEPSEFYERRTEVKTPELWDDSKTTCTTVSKMGKPLLEAIEIESDENEVFEVESDTFDSQSIVSISDENEISEMESVGSEICEFNYQSESSESKTFVCEKIQSDGGESEIFEYEESDVFEYENDSVVSYDGNIQSEDGESEIFEYEESDIFEYENDSVVSDDCW